MRHWWIGNPVFSAPWDITYPKNSSFSTHWGFHCEHLLMVYPWLTLVTQSSIWIWIWAANSLHCGKTGSKTQKHFLEIHVFYEGIFQGQRSFMAERELKTLTLEKRRISSSEMGSSHHNSQTSPQSPAGNVILVFQRIHTSQVMLGLIHMNSWKNEGQNEHWDHPPVGVQPAEEWGNSILGDSWINCYPYNQKFPIFLLQPGPREGSRFLSNHTRRDLHRSEPKFLSEIGFFNHISYK